MKPLTLVSLFVAMSLATVAHAEELSSQQILEQQDQWSKWADAGDTVHLTGRYRSRAGTRLQLQKLAILFTPERGIIIPDRLKIGTRLAISGHFVKGARKTEFRMTRLLVELSDYESLSLTLKKTPETDSATRYQLANQFEVIARFFNDKELQAAVDRCRTSTFAAQRKQHWKDADSLWKLVDPGPGFEISEKTLQDLRFEVLCLRANRKIDVPLIEDLKPHCSGWNIPVPVVEESIQEAFANNRTAAYAAADEPVRRQLERLLYRQLRLRQLLDTAKSDSSNALRVSAIVSQELPEEVVETQRLESAWADYRLKGVEQLKRRELDDLVTLLHRIERADDASPALDAWLKKQEFGFRDRGVEGQLRVANEYLHAWGKWKLPRHQQQGIEYLKRAWTTASRESPESQPEIEERLEHMGIVRMHKRWMTNDDVKHLPANDTERAERAGKVVPGMSLDQVRSILGMPSRRIRMATSRYIEDVWVYGERHTSRLTVRLRRSRTSNDDSATVIVVMLVSGT
jgi:hypothetical protein